MKGRVVRFKKPKGTCALPNCGEPARVAGMCFACYSWWNRCSGMLAGEFSAYLARARFRASRMVGRLSRADSVKHREKRKAS